MALQHRTATSLPISVVIINHRNDSVFQSVLGACVWADQIVVHDYDSQFDWTGWLHTTHYAGQLVVKTISSPLTDFAAARNSAVQTATMPWVLCVDSDEVLPHDAPLQITKLLTVADAKNLNGFWVGRQDYFLGQPLNWGETGFNQQLRLARKGKIHFSRAVHEQAQVQGATSKSSLTLQHYSHTSIADFFDTIGTYAYLEAKLRQESGQGFSYWQILVFPLGKFCYNWIGRLGILDGWRGLVYAVMMSLHSLLVRIYSYELTHHNNDTSHYT